MTRPHLYVVAGRPVTMERRRRPEESRFFEGLFFAFALVAIVAFAIWIF